MSYVIQIWEQPADVALPANPKAVWPMLDQLLKRSPGLNPKYIELARQLMALYPAADEPAGQGEVWLDGRADGGGDDLVWNLGLCSGGQLDKILTAVVVRANALGLNVADEQMGRVFLARPAPPAARARAAVDETPTEPAPLESLPVRAYSRPFGR